MVWKKVKKLSNSPLVSYTRISPNSSNPRNNKVLKITPHHMAGDLSLETFGNIVANPARQMSSNYAIDSQGRIGLFCEEKNRSWCSSSSSNDNQAITIEVANNINTEPWTISDAAMNSLIDLCVDICLRNSIQALSFTGDASGNLTQHNYFSATECPGTYLKSKFPYIAETVNARLQGGEPVGFIEQIAQYVQQYAPQYNIAVHSPIIAQAIIESASGTSELAVNAQNYFGLKYRDNRCPTAIGKYAKETKEWVDGQYITITSDFFKFSNMQDGVIGYFDFTNISNYANLKGVTDPRTYTELIKADGYATSPTYVDTIMNTIEKYNLTQYDGEPTPKPEPTPIEGKLLLKSYGTKNMQGFAFPDANGAVTYDNMPNGYRVVTERAITGTDGQGWEWVKLLDERNGNAIYTPLLSDRNELLDDAPLLEPESTGSGDCDERIAELEKENEELKNDVALAEQTLQDHMELLIDREKRLDEIHTASDYKEVQHV